MSLENKKWELTLPTCNDSLLWETLMSMVNFPTLVVADKLGLFSLLNQTPATASDLANSLCLGMRATEALVGVMTSLGFLVQHNGIFSLTEVSRNFLLPESPYYWGAVLKETGAAPLSASTLLTSLINDKSSVHEGQDIWEFHQLEPEQAKLFTAVMHSRIKASALGATRHGNFTGVKQLLDVGGGSGVFSIALAQYYPQMHCTVLELPVVCPIAEEYIAQAGLSDKINVKAGNFFKDTFPSGYDAMLFSDIFHDWSWQKCLSLAKNCFDALPSGGRIYLHEILLSDTKDTPLVATSYSMCMIWCTEGKQFTANELYQLLRECGFEEISIIPTYGYYSLISAIKP